MKISDLADTSKRTFPLQEPIAIIGVGCRYSGGINNLEDFWKVLIEKKSTLHDVPIDRFTQSDHLFDSDRGYRKIVSKRGGWLDNLKDFDAKFFKISPREAEKVDPHQRLMLEVTYEALEDAGLKLEDVWGTRTGVYAGMWSSDFEHILTNSKDDIDVYSTTGSGRYGAAGRLAYFFNLQGPTFTLDTACSTSLVAIHLACQSLHLRESDMSVCSAANLILDSFVSIGYSRSRLLSDYGKCRFGAKDASGYVRTEGAATVILKRLSDAERDGDFIYGVIPGSACNSDGQSHKHMMAPSAITQEIMIKDAMSRAHIAPHLIQYVEAHGTGTKAGDPAEIASITGALSEGRNHDDVFYVGSIKTNLGHTEAASGVAGLIKVLLSIQHRTIPGNLYADEEKNPNIPWNDLSLKIPSEAVDWPHPERPLLAGLNSFGISGTNAHVIIQEAPKVNLSSNSFRRKYNILPVSAANEKALQEYCKLYLPLFEKVQTEDELFNLVKNIAIRKADLAQRAAIVFKDKSDIISALQSIISGNYAENVSIGYSEEKKRTALVFPGQGAQWVGMGRDLYESEPMFKNAIDEFAFACQAFVSWSLLDELLDDNGLQDIDIIQPALLAVEIALAKWWQSIGLDYKAVIGHSMGEIGAAYLAGAITIDVAAAIICTRSQLMKTTSGHGAMAYIALPPSEVAEQFKGREGEIGIGVNNSPSSCVISGRIDIVDEICNHFEQTGAFVRKVKVDVASHSPQMYPLVDELREKITALQPNSTAIDIFSTVYAKEVNGEELDAEYWTKNLSQTVRFSETVQRMIQEGYGYFVEVSPHPTLIQALLENAESVQSEIVAVGSIEREKDNQLILIQQVANYYANGGRISWKKFYDLNFEKILLPVYPWQRVRYWVEENTFSTRRVSSLGQVNVSEHPFLSQSITLPKDVEMYVWETEISLREYPYLKDHKIQDTVIFPGAGYIEIIWAALANTFESSHFLIQNVALKNALPIQEDKDVVLQVVLTKEIENQYQISIYSIQETDDELSWVEHAEASVFVQSVDSNILDKESFEDISEYTEGNVVVAKEEHYKHTSSIQLPYGEAFQTVNQLNIGTNFIVADIQLNSLIQNSISKYFIHPAILDGFIQTFLAAKYLKDKPSTFVPIKVEEIYLHHFDKDVSGGKIKILLQDDNLNAIKGDAIVLNDAGQIILELKGFELARLEQDSISNEQVQEQILFDTINIEQDIPSFEEKSIIVFVADDISEELLDAFQPKWVVRKGDFFHQQGNQFIINPSSFEDYQSLFSIVGNSVNTVVHTWSLDEKSVAGLDAQENSTLSVVRIARAVVYADAPPKIWVLTDSVEKFPAQSTVIGMLNVLRNEHPELNASSIEMIEDDWGRVAQIVNSSTEENTWKIFADTQVVERLSPIDIQENIVTDIKKVPANHQSFAVEMSQPGILDNIEIKKKQLPRLKAHEVKVKVEAIGINFMNLMSALGIYPGKENGFATLGIECAGIVDEVGVDVEHLKVGDRVFGMAYHTMASHIHVDASLMQIIPDNLSFEEAATIPVVYLTVYYGLIIQSKLQKGERVLIHSATGGVGLAAIQVAQMIGAEIFATAGNEEKRELLHSLGVHHVYDSRNLDFAEQILKDTSGEGIDVVLNSLTGSAMVKSMHLLRSFGRFVEIGKKDVYANSKVGLEVFSKGLSYYMIDFEKMVFEKPQLVGDLLGELVPYFEDGGLTPIQSKIFHVTDVKSAFEYMSLGKHIGKIVIQINSDNVFLEELVGSKGFTEDATYLLTGGYGGLGLTFAQYMVAKGARRLLLTGRTGYSDNEIIHQLRSLGAEIIIDKADVSEREDIERILAIHHSNEQPLKGVFHLAGILDDASILNLDEDAFYRVLSPKVLGAYNLHITTQAYDLEHFVLFSSSTILFGSPGQAAYVAANKYMDALVEHRERLGLGGLSIQWGTVSDVGLAASADNRSERLEEEGVAPLSPKECTDWFDVITQMDIPVVGAFRFDLAKWQQAYPSSVKNHFYDLLRKEDALKDEDVEVSKELSLTEILSGIDDLEIRLSTLENQLKEIVGHVVKLPADDIHIKTTFKSLGIDSLMSIQLKNQLEKVYATSLSVTAFWTHSNIRDYAKFLLEKLKLNIAIESPEKVQKEIVPTQISIISEPEPIVEEVKEVQPEILEEKRLETKDVNEDELSLDDLSKLLDDELNSLLD
ncbi:MAG: SDR family NAD(P)-dependent oxidoreductase [Chitinophagales bacterium]|nr:SDR family NAD(P)-dependent oxidoreductase [Chitinophagales bacterium]